MSKRIIFLFIPLWMMFIMACRKTETIPEGRRGALISFSEEKTLRKDEVIARITELDGASVARYDVRYHAIRYRTLYEGKSIESQGLLILPENRDTVRLLAYFHGTELPLKQAGIDGKTPSLYNGSTEDYRDVRNMGLAWASAGYTVFIPDYIGYGITLGKDHPYMYYPEMFVSNIDGLLAVKDFLAQQGLPYNNRLFLAGWSQGGGAALSAQRYIEADYTDVFEVAASSSLAGPHHFYRFVEEIFARRSEESDILPIISWGIYAINKFSGLKRPADQLFSYPVFDQYSAMLVPGKKPDEVFNRLFLANFLNGKDTRLRDILLDNTMSAGWKPAGKVFLHHGDADNIVPYYNATDTRDGLTAAGGDVYLYTYPGGKHDTELGNFIRRTLADFDKL